jgi:hypothetical protein
MQREEEIGRERGRERDEEKTILARVKEVKSNRST